MNTPPASSFRANVALALLFSFLFACTSEPQAFSSELSYRTISSAHYYYAKDVKDCSSFRKSYGAIEQDTTLEATGRTAVCNGETLVELRIPQTFVSNHETMLVPERLLEPVEQSTPLPTSGAAISGEMALDNIPLPLVVGLVMNEEGRELWEFNRLFPEPPLTYHGITKEYEWQTWTTRPDEAGRFAFHGLMPGEYHLFALLEHYKLRIEGRVNCWTDQGIEMTSKTTLKE